MKVLLLIILGGFIFGLAVLIRIVALFTKPLRDARKFATKNAEPKKEQKAQTKHEKIIPPNEGEYVDYEEVK